MNESRWGLLVAAVSMIFQIIAVIQNQRNRPGKRRKRRGGRHRKR